MYNMDMETVKLSPYNHQWPEQFETIRQTLQKALGNFNPHIEHIGSTSVPGLMAKPVIDILIGVRDFKPEPLINVVEALGYEHWQEDEFQHVRLMFVKWDNGERDVNIHITPIGSDFWKDQIAFRDALRANPNLASDYVELKIHLAEKYRNDPEGYTEAKTAFVRGVLKISNYKNVFLGGFVISRQGNIDD